MSMSKVAAKKAKANAKPKSKLKADVKMEQPKLQEDVSGQFIIEMGILLLLQQEFNFL